MGARKVTTDHRVRGDIVKALRLARRQDVATLAAAIGIQRPYLSLIETGRRTGIRHLDAFAQALDVHPDVLLGRAPAIAALREANGHSRDFFAAAIGIGRSQLDRLERGTELPDDHLAEFIARRLGVPLAVIRPRRATEAAA